MTITISWQSYIYNINELIPGSAVLSPLGRLHPEVNQPFEIRIQALREIAGLVEDYPIAVRAIEWLAFNDEDIRIREVAQKLLDAMPSQLRKSNEDEL